MIDPISYLRDATVVSLLLLSCGCGRNDTDFADSPKDQFSGSVKCELLESSNNNLLLSELASDRLTTATYRIENLQDKSVTLQISAVSCGCLSVYIKEVENVLPLHGEFQIASHKSKDITIVFKPTLHPGLQLQTAQIISKNQIGPAISFTLRAEANILPAVTINPPALTFNTNNITSDKSNRQVTIVYACKTSEHSIDNPIPHLLSDVPEITIGTPILEHSDSVSIPQYSLFTWVVPVNLSIQKHGLNTKPIETCMISAAVGNHKIFIPTTFTYTNGIYCTPHNINFGRVTSANNHQRNILLQARDGKPFSICSAKSTLTNAVKISYRLTPSVTHIVQVEFLPDRPVRSMDEISLTIDHSSTDTITVPIEYIFAHD